MVEQLDPAAVESLYAETPDRFIAARVELVATLKGSDRPDAAKEAASLRKPTVAAWAVDRIARDHVGDIESLIAVGKDLASAQRGAVAGGRRRPTARGGFRTPASRGPSRPCSKVLPGERRHVRG